ncbi:protein mobD [Hydrogenovibrio crunogenus]|uniref:Protein mobD n=1 Tax=Hydrogenovibrio crunogenus TaxID=39765 RepID=A0A4P7NYU2_9GAMM|nr:ParA family protein [Hydrogenovibrio crunogenus]QBZ82749.1 protein mobD [Hydrogenovibrio crunogenus]
MSKTIYISHGDKGGCGKSLLAMIIASILSVKKMPLLLVEADANQSGGQPDVAPRFENDDYAEVVMAPISGQESAEDLIADLFEIIEQTDVEHIVINTPAGASETLEQVGELIGLACKSLGYRLVIFYNIFKTEVAVKQAELVLEGNLVKHADELYLVKNAFFGIPELSSRISLLESFEIPVLHKNVMEKLGDRQNFAKALKTFPIMQRIQVEQFFKSLQNQGFFEVLKLEEQ